MKHFSRAIIVSSFFVVVACAPTTVVNQDIPSSTVTPRATVSPTAQSTQGSSALIVRGVSINPVDKGRTITTDTYQYTLNDVRRDGDVYLIDLTLKNLTAERIPFSTAIELRLTKDATNNRLSYYSPNLMYVLPTEESLVYTFAPGETKRGYIVKSATAYYTSNNATPPGNQMYLVVYNLKIPGLPEAGKFIIQ